MRLRGCKRQEQDEPHRFRNFYVRRTLRIFPLFYFIWLLVLIASFIFHVLWQPLQTLWFVYLGNYIRFIAGTTAVDHMFTSNPRVHIEIGHFWSLAVEEQFYLIWPLVVFYVRDRGKLIRICLSTIVAALLLRVVLLWTVPQPLLSMEFLYRMTFTQCDGFLLGGLLALWMRGPEKIKVLRHADKLLFGSLAALMVAWLANSGWHVAPLSSTSGWMSTYGYTLVDLASAGFILCALKPGTIVFRLTTLRPLQLLGKYSYGFYVYHVLLSPFVGSLYPRLDFSLPKPLFFTYLSLSWVADFLIIFVISMFSYHFIELPFLRLKGRFTVRHKTPAPKGALQIT